MTYLLWFAGPWGELDCVPSWRDLPERYGRTDAPQRWMTRGPQVILESSAGRGNPYVQATEISNLLAGRKLSSTYVNLEVKNSERLLELNKIYAGMLQGR